MLVLTLLFGACDSKADDAPPPGRSIADYTAKYGADAKARVDAVRKLKDGLAAAKVEGAPPDDIEILEEGGKQKSSSNAVLLYDDELGGERTKHFASIATGAGMSYCNHLAMLTDENKPEHKTVDVGANSLFYEVCAQLKYAVVIRVKSEQKPSVGELEESTNTQAFTPGRIEADAIVFALPGGNAVGGVSVVATNHDSMTADKYTDILEDDLRHDLYMKIAEHIRVPETAEKKYLQ